MKRRKVNLTERTRLGWHIASYNEIIDIANSMHGTGNVLLRALIKGG